MTAFKQKATISRPQTYCFDVTLAKKRGNRTGSRYGKHVPQHEIGGWIFDNTKFLDFGVHSFTVKAGRLLSVASSGLENGRFMGGLIVNSVKEKTELGRYPIRKQLPTELLLNHARSEKIGVSFSFEILTYAKSQNNLYNKFNYHQDW